MSGASCLFLSTVFSDDTSGTTFNALIIARCATGQHIFNHDVQLYNDRMLCVYLQ